MNVETPQDIVGRTLLGLSRLFAIVGGVGVLGITLMSVVSILGRELLKKPIQGDFEITQVIVAVCVAAFLPYCQFLKANIIVDFFTTGLSETAQNRLDAIGAILLALVMFLVAWRTGMGMLDLKVSGEETQDMRIPKWISYAFMAPGFALTGLNALYTAWESWTGRIAPAHSEAEDLLGDVGVTSPGAKA
jgi:TRAP-type C4-dicarboxylate transport system permease small subunit